MQFFGRDTDWWCLTITDFNTSVSRASRNSLPNNRALSGGDAVFSRLLNSAAVIGSGD